MNLPKLGQLCIFTNRGKVYSGIVGIVGKNDYAIYHNCEQADGWRAGVAFDTPESIEEKYNFGWWVAPGEEDEHFDNFELLDVVLPVGPEEPDGPDVIAGVPGEVYAFSEFIPHFDKYIVVMEDEFPIAEDSQVVDFDPKNLKNGRYFDWYTHWTQPIKDW